MFLFVCDQVDAGIVSLDSDQTATHMDARSQIESAKAQLQGTEFSRMLLYLTLPESGEETYAFTDTVRETARRYYPEGEIYVAGNSTNEYDFEKSFSRDNTVVSVVSLLIVLVVLLFTFKSAGMPILLILVIQGSIWINFSIPTITDSPLFFMSYLEELDVLQGMINGTLDDAQSASDSVSARVTRISDYADRARVSANSLTGQLSSFVDENVATANGLMLLVERCLAKGAPILDELSAAAGSLTDAAGALRETLDALESLESYNDLALAQLQTVCLELERTCAELSDGLDALDEALKLVGNGPELPDTARLQADLTELSKNAAELGGCVRRERGLCGRRVRPVPVLHPQQLCQVHSLRQKVCGWDRRLGRPGVRLPVYDGYRVMQSVRRRRRRRPHRGVYRQPLRVRHAGGGGPGELLRPGGAGELRGAVRGGKRAGGVLCSDAHLLRGGGDAEDAALRLRGVLHPAGLPGGPRPGGLLCPLGPDRPDRPAL